MINLSIGSVEKNVPYPVPKSRQPKRRKNNKYPFLKMEIGDSFHISARSKLERELARSRICGAASNVKGKKFSTRTFDDGIRVWRVA